MAAGSPTMKERFKDVGAAVGTKKAIRCCKDCERPARAAADKAATANRDIGALQRTTARATAVATPTAAITTSDGRTVVRARVSA